MHVQSQVVVLRNKPIAFLTSLLPSPLSFLLELHSDSPKGELYCPSLSNYSNLGRFLFRPARNSNQVKERREFTRMSEPVSPVSMIEMLTL